MSSTGNAALVKPPLQDLGAAASCPVCVQRFGLTKKKYHCKFCGLVVCGNCSKERAVVSWAQTMKRICDSCKVGETSVTSSEVLLQHIVQDWLASVQRGEVDATRTVLAQGHDVTGQQVLIRAMMTAFHNHITAQTGAALSDAMNQAEPAVAAICEAQMDLLRSRNLDCDLHVLSRLCKANLEIGAHLLAGRETALSTVDAASGAGLGDALMLSNTAKLFNDVHAECADLVGRVIMDDIDELLDHQLFKKSFEDIDGHITSWISSDVTMCCVEATFDDFFKDVLSWVANAKSSEIIVTACLTKFVASYLQRMLSGQLLLDPEGRAVVRLGADLTVLERCFNRYQIVKRPALAQALQPLRSVIRLVGTAPETLPGAVQQLQPLFGEFSVSVARGLLHMRQDLPPEEEAAVSDQLSALPPPLAAPNQVSLRIRPQRKRRESVRIASAAAAAAAEAAAAARLAAEEELKAASEAKRNDDDNAAMLAARQAVEAAKRQEKEAAESVTVANKSLERRQEFAARKAQELKAAKEAADERMARMNEQVSRVESKLGVAQQRLDYLLDQPEPDDEEGVRRRNKDIAAARHQLVAAREAARLTAKKRDSVTQDASEKVMAIEALLPADALAASKASSAAPVAPMEHCVDVGFMQRFLMNFTFFGMCAGEDSDDESSASSSDPRARTETGEKLPVGFGAAPAPSTGGSS